MGRTAVSRSWQVSRNYCSNSDWSRIDFSIVEYNNLWHYWLILSTSLLRIKINRSSVFENTKTCPLVSNKIQIQHFRHVNLRTLRKKRGERRGGRKRSRLTREKSNKRFRPTDRWIFVRIFMVHDKRPIPPRVSLRFSQMVGCFYGLLWKEI